MAKDQQPYTLSDRQRSIRNLVEHQRSEEPRVIESVEDLAPRNLMAIPDEMKEAYPERAWKWLAVDSLQSEIDLSNGLYVTCNRSNSTKIPARFFDDATGGILYAGQNILAYTYRKNIDLINKKTIHDFDMSEKAMKEKINRTYHNASGKAIVTIEETDQYSSGGYGVDGPGSQPFVLNDNPELQEKYDFGDPA